MSAVWRKSICSTVARVICVTIALIVLLFSLTASGAETAEKTVLFFPHGTLTFDERMELVSYSTQAGETTLDGILVDPGADGAFLLDTIGHQRFWDMNTWDLARVIPKPGAPGPQQLMDYKAFDDKVEVITRVENIQITRAYTPQQEGLRVDASITNLGRHPVEIQGINFQLSGIAASEHTAFRFPGNVPYDIMRLGDLRHFAVRQAAYCAPLVRVDEGESPWLNLLFLNQQEKWSTALWRDRDYKLHAAFLAMAEGLLKQNETYAAGPLYLQNTAQEKDPYAPVRALYAAQGWQPPADGVKPVGPMYSAHPHGTMDSGFRDRFTMDEYADVLPGLADMGIENVWILPIFEHTGRGVYEPTDQAIIDPRYGADAQVRAFSDAAHEAGIRVLYDYVPHGPYPNDPLAKDNPQWCSVHRSGELQIEWDCVSFDMANPDYQRYTKELVMDHVTRFDVDGGRIDCAMGGLSNWQPGEGRRASNSGILGGVEIVNAIRQGFLASGKQPLLLPENFHPLPFYAPVTDVFYDMPLYRAMFEMRQKNLGEKAFAITLSRWLADEYQSGVPGLTRLRFLGNHDTVSWTWDRARATQVYGEDKAKALWTLFSFIDGAPFLYQGDELSSIYDRRTGLDLRPFFKELFAARKAHLDADMDISYHPNDTTLIAFTRAGETGRVLGLVNLGAEPVTWPVPDGADVVLYGEGRLVDGLAQLDSYQSLLIQLP